ncbi:hypothetical protein G5B37_04710 [Rasiella rasia]|uniref:Uncharacterized protein n=1 Tax=Rasiella rasia TaxID=2744027 RepID=A0A6G6GK37_9FLAO|nr:hypothetical protein [Rasiella rasia]QIE58887.1 hypothetical protein G5B37_04710 [Rasiella rasia]
MRHLYILLTICFTVPILANAQIGGSVFDAAKNASSDATEDAKEKADRKAVEQGMQDFFGGINKMADKPMLVNCLSIMSEHARQLAELQNQFEQEEECKKKKEYIEAQSLAALSAGTIIYCPDELNSDKVMYGKKILEFLRPFFVHNMNGGNASGGENLYEKLQRLKSKLKALHQEVVEMSSKDVEYKMEHGPALWSELQKTLQEITEISERLASQEAQELPEDLVLINTILSNYLYAEIKFGNRYSSIKTMAYIINPENIPKEEDRAKFYISVVDYFTYYTSPEFMLKRADEIDFIRRNLPCN